MQPQGQHGEKQVIKDHLSPQAQIAFQLQWPGFFRVAYKTGDDAEDIDRAVAPHGQRVAQKRLTRTACGYL